MEPPPVEFIAERSQESTNEKVASGSKELTAAELGIDEEKPIDKRSGLVDRKRAVKQVLCHMCCAEFGTSSLGIHQKTCSKKHSWGLENVLHEEGIDKKKAEANRKKCSELGDGPTLTLPTAKSSSSQFQEYNDEAFRIFCEHSKVCLWCREKNVEAIEAARWVGQGGYHLDQRVSNDSNDFYI